MRYRIHCRIAYEYDHRAGSARHHLRLMPAIIPGVQRLVAGHIEISPKPEEENRFSDFFGNQVTAVANREPHQTISFSLHAQVQREEPMAALAMAPPLSRMEEEIRLSSDRSPSSPLHYMADTARIARTKRLSEFARDHVRGGMDAIEAMEAVALALHREMTFDPEATEVDTLPEDAFDRRRGVCQDYTQILIACLRGIHIPAAYVSGYLRTVPPPGQPRLAGADAMHAWVRAWCGRAAGWREYDPTNALRVASDHVMVAVGRDYADIAPVRGIARLAGGQATKQSVDLVPE